MWAKNNFFKLKIMKGTYKVYVSFKIRITFPFLQEVFTVLSRPWCLLFHQELKSDYLSVYSAFYCWGNVHMCVLCVGLWVCLVWYVSSLSTADWKHSISPVTQRQYIVKIYPSRVISNPVIPCFCFEFPKIMLPI